MKKLISYSTFVLLPILLIAGCGGEDGAQDAAPADTADTMAATAPAPAQAPAAADTLTATLSGDVEVPGPGAMDGSGTAEVVLDQSEGSVCFEIDVENVAEPQAAHIHRGAADESGPPVVDFNVGENGLSGCVDTDETTMAEILASPSDYYVNVHNEEFPGGAVRGQLGRSM